MLSLPGGAPGAAAGGAAEPPADDDAPEATGAVATFFAAGWPVAASGALLAAMAAEMGAREKRSGTLGAENAYFC